MSPIARFSYADLPLSLLLNFTGLVSSSVREFCLPGDD